MNTSEEKKKLFNLLFQLNDYSIKIYEISKEINIITQKLNISTLNLNSYIQQLNTLAKKMKLDINQFYNQFRINKVNIPQEKELKIYIGFKQPSGEVHTFEAEYGTTVDKLISTYLKQIMKDKNPNEIVFEYKDKLLDLGDMTAIENIFNDRQNPTVIIKSKENSIIYKKRNEVNNDTDFNFI